MSFSSLLVNRLPLGLPIVILLAISVGFQIYDGMLRATEPFYYHSVKITTPEVRRGEKVEQVIDVERFRICKVTVERFMVSFDTGDVFYRESAPAGATKVGRNLATNRIKVPEDAPLGDVRLIQNVSSHCIEGMHTMAWPELYFRIVE